MPRKRKTVQPTAFVMNEFQLALSQPLCPKVDPKPPARLLLEKSKFPASKRAIANKNDQRSPLLSLPAEIRLQILKEVMGGNDIHIKVPTEPGRHLESRMCTEPQDVRKRSADRLVVTHDIAPWRNSFSKKHKFCEKKGTSKSVYYGLNLDVLQVCRRLYHEAALLPFECNTFAIGPPDNMSHAERLEWFPETTEMRRFSDYLHPIQRDAVCSLTITTLSTLVQLNKTEIVKFQGLKKLHIIAAGCGDLDQQVMCRLLWNEWDRAKSCDLSELRRLDSVRLSVEGYFDCPWLEGLGTDRQVKCADDILRRIETRVLRCAAQTPGRKKALRKLAGAGDDVRQLLEDLSSREILLPILDEDLELYMGFGAMASA